MILLLCMFAGAKVHAQEEEKSSTENTVNTDTLQTDQSGQNRIPEDGNDKTFRDDSTDAAVGLSGLGTTPGASTTTGAGGLGTNETPGYNTSSDIYTIERRDSIEKANRRERANREKR